MEDSQEEAVWDNHMGPNSLYLGKVGGILGTAHYDKVRGRNPEVDKLVPVDRMLGEVVLAQLPRRVEEGA